MATFPTAINETRALKLGDKFPYLLWHELTIENLLVYYSKTTYLIAITPQPMRFPAPPVG